MNNYYGFLETLKKDDERKPVFLLQLAERGFDDTETWSLFWTLANLILPRLKRFKEIAVGYPHGMTPEEWNDILEKMIVAFTLIVDDNLNEKEASDIVNEGLDMFRLHFLSLWW